MLALYFLKRLFRPIRPENIDPAAFAAGRAAFLAGDKRNPHAKGGCYYASWYEGYIEEEMAHAQQW